MWLSNKLINTEEYKSLVSDIQKKTNAKVLTDYQENVAERDSQKLHVANISFGEAFEILSTDKLKFYQFVIGKMKKFEGIKFAEDFPEGEAVEKENDNEIVLGYSPSFLLLYLIEYFLLKNRPDDLLPYLRSIRIPQAPQYQKELILIYKAETP